MDKIQFLFFLCLTDQFEQSLQAPVNNNELDKAFTDHRLDLLENGFNVFADEFIAVVQKLEQKVHTFTDANKELRRQLQDVTNHDEELTKTVKVQEKVISDLLWAVADLKERRADNGHIGELRQADGTPKKGLAEIEWTLFDLKYSTEQILEEMCMNEAKCSDWSEWSECEVDCGIGRSLRFRNCSNSGKFHSYCSPAQTETKSCSGTNCNNPAQTVTKTTRTETKAAQTETKTAETKTKVCSGTSCRTPAQTETKACSGTACSLLKAKIKVTTTTHFRCPESFIYFKGYCLRFSGRSDDRNLATIICETDDAHIVEIDSLGKNDAVMAFLEKEISIFMQYAADNSDKISYSGEDYIDKTSQIAIDGILYKGERNFVSWKEHPMMFYRWAYGEPRTPNSNIDYCVSASLEDNLWYSYSCTNRLYYVCEAPLIAP